MSTTILEVKDLIKDYGTYRAVDRVSFSIQKGQVLGLLGPNGAGKSTTIQMLMGVTLPTAGKILYFGNDFATHRQASLGRINYASAYNWLQHRITIKENLLVFAGLYGVPNAKQKIAELLDYFEISRLGNHTYRTLSAGERTRVNLIKGLLNDPELLLMDEPTASLDPDIADKVLSLIERLRKERQLAILFTSHNMSEVERICDQVIFLDKGTIVSQDTPGNHTKRLGNVVVQVHFGGPRKAIEQLAQKQRLACSFIQDDVVHISVKASQVGKVIAAIAGAGVTMHDVEVQKPDLQDVFLNIARGDRS